MSARPADRLQSKAINGWRLFWLITAPISAAVILKLTTVDLTSARGVSSMIEIAVRCAIPLLFVTFAASSINVLFPGAIGRWFLRNRKYLGLSYAAAMAWQLFFILWMVTQHTEHYVDRVYATSDVIEGIGGYLLLIAMVITSFRFGRSRLSAKQWNILHKVGIYWLWTYAFITYWWYLFYSDQPLVINYVYYWMGFFAWGMRMAAWTKKRWSKEAAAPTRILTMLPGAAFVVVGLVGVTIGSPWGKAIYDFGFSVPALNTIGVYTPYFPFVPYWPLLLIVIGAGLILRTRQQTA